MCIERYKRKQEVKVDVIFTDDCGNAGGRNELVKKTPVNLDL